MQYQYDTELGSSGYLGEVRQDPNGQLYELAEVVDDLGNIGLGWMPLGEAEEDMPTLGEVRTGADGQLYQYTQTIDGLGNIGFAWASLIPIAAQAAPSIIRGISSLFRRRRRRRPGRGQRASQTVAAIQRALPQIARLTANILAQQRGGVAGLDEYDMLYGLDEDLELDGLDEDLEIEGLDEDLDLYGLDEDLELEGLDEDYDLYGLDEDMDEELGLDEEDMELGDLYLGEDGSVYEFQGLEQDDPEALQGYLQEEPPGRLNGYVKGAPSPSPRFKASTTPPDIWKPLWS